MKKTIAIIVTLGLAAASQAVLIDDFESYALGDLNARKTTNPTSGWYGIDQNTTTGNADVVDVDGNKAGMAYASSSATRGVWKAVSGVTEGTTASLTFDIMLNTTTFGPNIYFGFATIIDTVNNVDPRPFGDYEAFVGLQGDGAGGINFKSYDGTNAVVLSSSINASQWYSVTMDVDTVTDTYDVWLGGSLVGDGLKFRQNTGEDAIETKSLDTVTLMASKWNTQSSSLYGAVDNINLTVVPEPGTLGLMAAGAGLLFWRRRSAR